MASLLEAVGLWTSVELLRQVPIVTWVGVCLLGIGASVYWALDFYLFEALFRKYAIVVEAGEGSSVSSLVMERCASLRKRYRSTPWLCSPHVQTIYLHFDKGPRVKYRREVYQLSDGGCIGLDWSGTEQPATPTVAIIPGLTSDSSNAYLKYLVADITARGWRSVIINHRGLGGVSLTSETFYDAGWTRDMREVLSEIGVRLPSAPLALIGTSLGANMIIKYLGEEGTGSRVWGGVAVGCPFDLLVCDRFMNRTFIQRFWNSGLARGLKEFAELHKEPFSKVVDFTLLQTSRTLREFDDRITRFTSHFETVDTYYRRCSSAPYITAVSTPLLAMSVLDDPICTKESIPWDECRLNPYVTLATAPRGGHLAIYYGWFARRLLWTEPCVEFLGGIFDKGFRGLEPVAKIAPSGSKETVVPRGNLPLVHGVELGHVKANGLECNGVIEHPLEKEEDMPDENVIPKKGVQANGLPVKMNGVTEDLGEQINRKMPNGLLISDEPHMTDETEGEKRAAEYVMESSVREDRPKCVVFEFSDEGQAAAVESFLAEILDKMRGVATPPWKPTPSLNDAALAVSAAASASAIAAAAAAVVRSASAAALAAQTFVRNPSSGQNGSDPAHQGLVSPQKLDFDQKIETPQKAEAGGMSGRVWGKGEVKDLVKYVNQLTVEGSRGTWLLAYVAIAVSFPLVGAVMRMQALRRLEKSKGLLKVARSAGLK